MACSSIRHREMASASSKLAMKSSRKAAGPPLCLPRALACSWYPVPWVYLFIGAHFMALGSHSAAVLFGPSMGNFLLRRGGIHLC